HYNKELNLLLINLFLLSLLVFHAYLPWLYPTWLEDKYNDTFASTVSTAIVENLDWNILQQWLGNQKPLELYQDFYDLYATPYHHDENEAGLYRHFDEDIDNAIKLPAFAGNLYPAAIGLLVEKKSSPQKPTVAISLKYKDRGRNLVFVAPQTSYTEVMKYFAHHTELPISSQCNCFIGAKGWS
ncbi:MAG: hypothetical protein SAJ11_16250, partial [Jaaginema sp. PMC 1078.18]|nr:hypothetical protein [Jaaginema sp. PMC 1078.18]